MFDPYRLTPSRENFYYQRKGQVLRIRDRMPPPQPNYTKEDLKPLVPYFLQNRLAKRFTPVYKYEDIQMNYLLYTQPIAGINFPRSIFDRQTVPNGEELPDDFNIDEISFTEMNPENVCYLALFTLPDGNPGKIRLRLLITDWSTNFTEIDVSDPDQAADSIEDMVTPFRTSIPISIDTEADGFSNIYIIKSTCNIPNELYREGQPILTNFYESEDKPRLPIPITFSEGPVNWQFVDSQEQKFICQCYISDIIDIQYDTILYEFK